jgi:PAS domain S-box-containing protein
LVYSSRRFRTSGLLCAERNDANDIVGFTKVMPNMTGQKDAQEQLRESKERLRLFIENVTDYALFQVDTEARISSWNTGAARTFGYTEEEILGQQMRTLYPPEDAANGNAERDLELAREQGRFEDACWMVRKDGSRFFGRWVTTPMRDGTGELHGYAKVLRDETERRDAEQQMRASLAEKQALLQEIHHRVKNNLQVITSLLSIQASRIENPQVAAVLADTENRVRAIAALHETLYSSQDLASIEFGSYLQQLVRDLVSFYSVDRKRLQVTVTAEDLVVDIGQAIPLGLIVNELVTNALKHAFPGDRRGTLRVELGYVRSSIDAEQGQTLDEGLGRLTVQDDGVGMPPGLKFDETPSMGLHLVSVLVEQLRGTLEVETTGGTRITLEFPLAGLVSGFGEDGSNFYS